MRAVIQRVSQAEVRVDGNVTGRIGRGFLILLGVAVGDTDIDLNWMVEKVIHLRIFPNEEGNLTVPCSIFTVKYCWYRNSRYSAIAVKADGQVLRTPRRLKSRNPYSNGPWPRFEAREFIPKQESSAQ